MRPILFALLFAVAGAALSCVPSREWCYPCGDGKVRVCEGSGMNERCYCVQR